MTGVRPVQAAAADDRLDADFDPIHRALDRAAWDEAIRGCRVLLDRDPNCLTARYLCAAAEFGSGDLAAACETALAAHRLDPDCQAVATLLASIYAAAGQLNTAVYFHKLARAGSGSSLSRLLPGGFPTFDDIVASISERPLLMRAMVRLAAGDLEGAVSLFHQHLYFVPDDVEATTALAAALVAAGRLRAAASTLRAARHMCPDDAVIAGLLGKVLTQLGAFAEARACHAVACRQAPDDEALQADALLDRLADPDLEPAATAAAFVEWSEQKKNKLPAGGGVFTQSGEDSRPIVVGFLLGRRGAAEDGPALADILAERSRSRFAFVGFGGGGLAASSNVIFQKCMDRWQEVALDDPLTLAAVVRAEMVDILVDASGFSAPRLLTAFHGRMARYQVGWFDLPYVPPLQGLDAVLTDTFVDPADRVTDPRTAPGVRLLRLAQGSVVVPVFADRVPAEGGAEADVASDGLVYAADAGLAELHPAAIALWSDVLQRTPGATLLLRDHAFTDPETLAGLLALFGSFGISHRVDIVRSDDPVAFFATADIGLVAGPIPRPETVAAMLAAGLPLVCPAMAARPGRRAGSLLHHAGLADTCLAATAEDYVTLATRWAASADRRAAFRGQLSDSAWAPPPALRMRDIEQALLDLWSGCAAGTPVSPVVTGGH